MAVVLLLAACSQQKATQQTKKFTDIEALIIAQESLLAKGRYELVKYVEINGHRDTTMVKPDPAGWKTELNIFTQLDLINKPTYRDSYDTTTVKDDVSNLTINKLVAKSAVPVPSINFFYLKNKSDIRKITAEFVEDNALYLNRRSMFLEFELLHDTLVLRHYKFTGLQRMALSDTVSFSIEGEVRF